MDNSGILEFIDNQVERNYNQGYNQGFDAAMSAVLGIITNAKEPALNAVLMSARGEHPVHTKDYLDGYLVSLEDVRNTVQDYWDTTIETSNYE